MIFKESKAIYLQIADHLINKILQGEYKEGERIISVRECAADLEVNVNTCMRAYDWLCQQQVIFTKRGLGYFISDGAKEAINKQLREDFFSSTLPDIVQKMEVLGITKEELLSHL